MNRPPNGCGALRWALASLAMAAVLLPGQSGLAAEPRTDSRGGEYTLRWADEFNVDGPPSPANWAYETGFLRNEEAQWYQAENAVCQNGLLVIEARRERVGVDPEAVRQRNLPWARRRTHADYTSASLKTRGKHEWLYGRFEMRARIPVAEGAWPAFWTVGHGAWPACGEIDIMEYYDGVVLANVAWGGAGGWEAVWDAVRTPLSELGDASWSQQFHVWRMDWDEDSIDLYVDDRLLNSTDLSETINQDGSAANPFHSPHYLLVNLAIGGKHGGDPSQTTFPLRYEIDYVRVYQRDSAQKPAAASAQP